MVGIIATARVKDGEGPRFEEVARGLVEAVNANEPDCLLYLCVRSQEDANSYMFVERYRDQAALEFHTDQDYLRTVGPALFELLDGPPEIVRFDEI